MKLTLNKKVCLAIICVVFLALFATLFAMQHLVHNAMKQRLRERLDHAASTFSDLSKSRQQYRRDLAKTLTRSVSVDPLQQQVDLHVIVNRLKQLEDLTKHETIVLIDDQGRVVYRSKGAVAAEDLADRFDIGVDQTKGMATEVVLQGEEIVEVSTIPLFVGDRTLGFLSFTSSLDNVFVREVQRRTGVQVAVLLGGKLHTSAGAEPTTFVELVRRYRSHFLGKSQRAKAGFHELTLGTEEFLTHAQRVDSGMKQSCFVILQLSLTEAMAFYRQFQTLVVMLGVAIVALCFFLSARGIQRFIAQPVAAIAESAKLIAAGNSDHRLTLQQSSLFDDLIQSLNAMVVSLVDQQKELILARREAEAASLCKSKILANMSHDIKTPLNGIISLLPLLLESELDEEQREDLDTMVGCADSLRYMIDEVVDFLKLDAKVLHLDERPVDLDGLFTRVVKKTRAVAEGRNSHLQLLHRTPSSRNIEIDARRLEQVFVSLLLQVMEVTTFEADITLGLQAVHKHGEKSILHFAVCIFGGSTARDQQDAVYEALDQLIESSDGDSSIGGLGFAVGKKLIALMGGKIWLERLSDRGLILHVSVVGSVGDEHEEHESLPMDPEITAKATELIPLSVLIVEDNPVNQDVLSRHVKKHGHRVSIVENGEEALAAIQKEQFDIILMDLQMPVMGGIEATQCIRDLEGPSAAVPIIAVTANMQSEERERCFSVGMNDYVSKPVNYPELFRAMHKVVSREGEVVS